MSLVTRTAMLTARVRPEIKFASENVLRRMGLNLTEAMELFLSRVIVDQKLPFEVVAIDERTYSAVVDAWKNELKSDARIDAGATPLKRRKNRAKRE